MGQVQNLSVDDAVAEAWASIDGKLDEYRLERDQNMSLTDPRCKGHWEGYLAEADELIKRIRSRGYVIVRAIDDDDDHPEYGECHQ